MPLERLCALLSRARRRMAVRFRRRPRPALRRSRAVQPARLSTASWSSSAGSCGTGCSSMIVRHQNPSSSCCGVCDTRPASCEPVQPPLHALAVALDEPGDRLLVAAVGDPPPAHDRRQADDELRERAAIARRAVAAGPLLPPPPPPQVREHRDRRGLQARVPLVQPPGAAAGVLDRGEDLDAERLGGKRRGMAERAPGGGAGTALRLCGGGDCHRQRRCTRRSRRQSREGSRRPSGIGRPRLGGGSVRPSATVPRRFEKRVWARPCGAIRDRSPVPTTELLLGRRSLRGPLGHSSCATAEAPPRRCRNAASQPELARRVGADEHDPAS